MANFAAFHKLLIISFASFISCKPGPFRPSNLAYYDLFDLDKPNYNQLNKNDYHAEQQLKEEHPPQYHAENWRNREQQSKEEHPPQYHVQNWRYRSIIDEDHVQCQISITEIVLEESGFEFSPKRYLNKTCSPSSDDPNKIQHNNGLRKNEICLHYEITSGCTTLSEQLSVYKRRTGSGDNCWEQMQIEVPVGCKCNIHFLYD